MGNVTYDFSGRTAIVTGAGQGIGLELARFFRGAGASVWMVDVDGDLVAEAAAAIGGHAVAADVSDTADVQRAVDAAVDATGRVDILVNNAGVLRDNVLWKLTDDDWDTVLRVHLGGTFRFTRACVPHFRAQSSGRVVNVSSYTGMRGNVGQAAYAAAKAGIIGFTLTAAKELGRFGVTVNAISPNADTRMIASMPPEKRRQIEEITPLGRFGTPAEMCGAVGFLASDDAAYVTGVVLRVDGGLAM